MHTMPNRCLITREISVSCGDKSSTHAEVEIPRDAALGALVGLIGPNQPFRELRLERVDREPVEKSGLAEALQALGFRPSYRGYLLRP